MAPTSAHPSRCGIPAGKVGLLVSTILLIQGAGCIRIVAPQATSDGGSPLAPGRVALQGAHVWRLSSPITRWDEASFKIQCGTGSQYAVVFVDLPAGASASYFPPAQSIPSAPSHESEWKSCPAQSLGEDAQAATVRVALPNTLNPQMAIFYFKTSSGDLSSATSELAKPVRRIDPATPYLELNSEPFAGQNLGDTSGLYGFKHPVHVLKNGNWVIVDSNADGTRGAVYLYDGETGERIATFRGNAAGDYLGNGGITELGADGSTFTIASPYAANGAIIQAGQVTLVSSATGAVIATLRGQATNDLLGREGITPLGADGSTFAIRSSNAANGANTQAGQVTVASSASGAVIATLRGQATNDQFGSQGITVLGADRSTFVIRSPYVANGALANAGEITLASSATGAVIATFLGQVTNEFLGQFDVTPLGADGGTFAILSPDAPNGALAQAGKVILASSSTGAVIATLRGTAANDEFGMAVIALGADGSTFAIRSPYAANGALHNAGQITLASSATGAVIATLRGQAANDTIGSGGFTALGADRSTFAIASPFAANGALASAGQVTLVSSSTGAVIATLLGQASNDDFGKQGSVALGKDRSTFAIKSSDVKNGANTAAGQVTLASSATGAVIATLRGQATNEYFGGFDVIPLGADGSTFAVTSPNAANGALASAGQVTLASSSTGAIIATLRGQATNDSFGAGGITPVGSSQSSFLIRSPDAANGALAGAGQITLVSSATGTILASMSGASNGDHLSEAPALVIDSSRALVLSPQASVNGQAGSGSIRLWIFDPEP